MDLAKKIENTIKEMSNMKFGDVLNFAKNLHNSVNAEIIKLEKKIFELRSLQRAFESKFLDKNYMNKTTVKCQVGGIDFMCPVIDNYTDAVAYPHQPCVIQNVSYWYFIAFPELNQILPVSAIEINHKYFFKFHCRSCKEPETW